MVEVEGKKVMSVTDEERDLLERLRGPDKNIILKWADDPYAKVERQLRLQRAKQEIYACVVLRGGSVDGTQGFEVMENLGESFSEISLGKFLNICICNGIDFRITLPEVFQRDKERGDRKIVANMVDLQ